MYIHVVLFERTITRSSCKLYSDTRPRGATSKSGRITYCESCFAKKKGFRNYGIGLLLGPTHGQRWMIYILIIYIFIYKGCCIGWMTSLVPNDGVGRKRLWRRLSPMKAHLAWSTSPPKKRCGAPRCPARVLSITRSRTWDGQRCRCGYHGQLHRLR